MMFVLKLSTLSSRSASWLYRLCGRRGRPKIPATPHHRQGRAHVDCNRGRTRRLAPRETAVIAEPQRATPVSGRTHGDREERLTLAGHDPLMGFWITQYDTMAATRGPTPKKGSARPRAIYQRIQPESPEVASAASTTSTNEPRATHRARRRTRSNSGAAQH